MNWKAQIGAKIRKAREARGWTLRELSEQTSGVLTPSRISNYEQGLRLPKPQDARILGKSLGIAVADLMCLVDGDVSPDETQLLTSWRALPENERKDYLRRITALSMVYRDPVPDERTGKHIKPAGTALPRRRRPSKA